MASSPGDTFPYMGTQARQSGLTVNKKQGVWGEGAVAGHLPVISKAWNLSPVIASMRGYGVAEQ